MTTVVCVASGPSLTAEQCALVTAAQAAGKCHAIVVNDNWRMVPTADVLYAADAKWWHRYLPDIEAAGFAGEMWTQDQDAATRHGLCHIKSEGRFGLSRDPKVIYTGNNSGYQAVGLAFHFGARRIVLVGYDFMRGPNGEAHWFGSHPAGFGEAMDPRVWAHYFEQMDADLKSEGVEFVNCSLRTSLKVRCGDLAETLAGLPDEAAGKATPSRQREQV